MYPFQLVLRAGFHANNGASFLAQRIILPCHAAEAEPRVLHGAVPMGQRQMGPEAPRNKGNRAATIPEI